MFRFVRRYFKKALRWIIVSWAFRFFLKSTFGQSAKKAGEELASKVPESVGPIVDSLPNSVKVAAGSAMVAGRSAKRVVAATSKAKEFARTHLGREENRGSSDTDPARLN